MRSSGNSFALGQIGEAGAQGQVNHLHLPKPVWSWEMSLLLFYLSSFKDTALKLNFLCRAGKKESQKLLSIAWKKSGPQYRWFLMSLYERSRVVISIIMHSCSYVYVRQPSIPLCPASLSSNNEICLEASP